MKKIVSNEAAFQVIAMLQACSTIYPHKSLHNLIIPKINEPYLNVTQHGGYYLM